MLNEHKSPAVFGRGVALKRRIGDRHIAPAEAGIAARADPAPQQGGVGRKRAPVDIQQAVTFAADPTPLIAGGVAGEGAVADMAMPGPTEPMA